MFFGFDVYWIMCAVSARDLFESKPLRIIGKLRNNTGAKRSPHIAVNVLSSYAPETSIYAYAHGAHGHHGCKYWHILSATTNACVI